MIDDSLQSGKSIFVQDKYLSMLNPEILPESIEQLPHRESQIKAVFNAYQSLLPTWTEVYLILGGQSGTGKTASMQLIENQLLKRQLIQVDQSEENLPRVFHINCEEFSSYSQILLHIIQKKFPSSIIQSVKEKLNIRTREIPTRGLSEFEYFLILKHCFHESRLPTLFVFDNFHKIKSSEEANKLISTVKRINSSLKEEIEDESAKMSIIIVLSEFKQLHHLLSDDMISFFYRQEVYFPAYKSFELLDILKTRLPALKEDVLEDGVLFFIASHVEEMNGCAKYAINLLRDSARLAQENNSPKIKIEHVERSIQRYSFNNLSGMVNRFSLHKFLLLLTLYQMMIKYNAKECKTSLIYEEYKKLFQSISLPEKCKQYRTIDRYLRQMAEAGIIVKSRKIGTYRDGVQVTYRLSDRFSPEVIRSSIEQHLLFDKYQLSNHSNVF